MVEPLAGVFGTIAVVVSAQVYMQLLIAFVQLMLLLAVNIHIHNTLEAY